MINQSTIDKLIEMRLTSMADAFRIQMDDLAMKEVPFEDRFGMLVDVEYTKKQPFKTINKKCGVGTAGCQYSCNRLYFRTQTQQIFDHAACHL